MDLFFYNMVALCADISVMFVLIEIINPFPESRKTLVALILSYVTVERIIVGITDLPIEWTTLLLFLFCMLRFGTGSIKQRLIRYFVGIMFVNLMAVVSLPWVLVYGTSFASMRYEILSYPDYFVSQALMIAVFVAFIYPTRTIVGITSKRKLSSIEVPGLLYLAVQAIALTVLEVSSVKAPQYSSLSLLLVQSALVMSFVVSLVFLHGVHLSVETSENSAYAEAVEELSREYVKQYAGVEQEIEAAAVLRHDMRNQLEIAEALGRSGDVDSARDMLDGLETRIVAQQENSQVHLVQPELSQATLRMPDSFEGMSAVPRNIWIVGYVASLVLSAIVWIDIWQHYVDSPFVLSLCLAAIVVMAILSPFLVKKIQEAQRYEISQVRAAAAHELLDSSVYYTKRLEDEHAQLDELRMDLLRDVQDVRNRLEGGTSTADAADSAKRCAYYERYCEHPALDTLLALKAHECHEHSICHSFEVDVREGVSIDNLSLCALFSNALNNAIAACEKLGEGERWIELHARMQAGIMAVSVSNSAGQVEGAELGEGTELDGGAGQDEGAERGALKHVGVADRAKQSREAHTGGGFLQEQPELKGHGWGLRILSALVAERDGKLTVSTEPGVFRLRVTLRV